MIYIYLCVALILAFCILMSIYYIVIHTCMHAYIHTYAVYRQLYTKHITYPYPYTTLCYTIQVRVFRIVSASPVEEKILARATDKKNLNGLVVEAGVLGV